LPEAAAALNSSRLLGSIRRVPQECRGALAGFEVKIEESSQRSADAVLLAAVPSNPRQRRPAGK
jgi:hypothetical protein